MIAFPHSRIVVKVSEVFMHCAKAFRRSQLWNPEHFQDRTRDAVALKDHSGPDNWRSKQMTRAMRKLDDELEDDYKRTLYRPLQGCHRQEL